MAEIGIDPDKPQALTGHYFYRSYGVSILLKGVRAQYEELRPLLRKGSNFLSLVTSAL